MVDYRQVLKQLDRVFSKQIVFIVGATRWGTSWIQQALDAHPEICCKGDGHFADFLFPTTLKLLDRYNAQVELADRRLRASGLPGGEAGYTFDDVDFLLSTLMGLTFNRWVGDREVKVIAEKTPEHVLSLELLVRAAPGAKVIHVIRDGRDEAYAGWEFNTQTSQGEFQKKFPRFVDFADFFSKNWARSVGSARRYGRAHRQTYFQVVCEELDGDAAAFLRRLFRFLGVRDDIDVAMACVKAARAAVPRDIPKGTWKKHFDEESIRVFRRQAGELLKLIGYED